MICVSIGRTRHKMVIAEHKHLAEKGAELVELRVDWLSRMPDVGRLLQDRPTPCVLTCRRKEDRGRWRGTEDQRMTILRTGIVSGVEYVDLEDDIAGNVPRYGETKRIISHHNFDETPDDLETIHERLTNLDPDIVKIVTMANSTEDMVRMLKLVVERQSAHGWVLHGRIGPAEPGAVREIRVAFHLRDLQQRPRDGPRATFVCGDEEHLPLRSDRRRDPGLRRDWAIRWPIV